MDNAGALMGEIELDAERQMMNLFLAELSRPHPKATYGEMMVRDALEQGAVDRLLLSEGLRKSRAEMKCNSCSHQWIVTIARTEELPACPRCSTNSGGVEEIRSESLIDELTFLSTKSNTSISFISSDTEEGSQLLQGFGGLAALLRYPLM